MKKIIIILIQVLFVIGIFCACKCTSEKDVISDSSDLKDDNIESEEESIIQLISINEFLEQLTYPIGDNVGMDEYTTVLMDDENVVYLKYMDLAECDYHYIGDEIGETVNGFPAYNINCLFDKYYIIVNVNDCYSIWEFSHFEKETTYKELLSIIYNINSPADISSIEILPGGYEGESEDGDIIRNSIGEKILNIKEIEAFYESVGEIKVSGNHFDSKDHEGHYQYSNSPQTDEIYAIRRIYIFNTLETWVNVLNTYDATIPAFYGDEGNLSRLTADQMYYYNDYFHITENMIFDLPESDDTIETGLDEYQRLIEYFLQINQTIDNNEDAFSIDGITAEAYPNCYAGAYLDTEGSLKILLTKDSDESEKEDLINSINDFCECDDIIYDRDHAIYSYRTLMGIMQSITESVEAKEEAFDCIEGFGIDVEKNNVVVYVNTEDENQLKIIAQHILNGEAIEFLKE